MELKLISTEFDEETIQLTYTDGAEVDDAKAMVVLRLPVSESFNRSINWHEFKSLERLYAWLDGRLGALDAIMKKGN